MKAFILFSMIALTSLLPANKAFCILITDRFGSVDVGTRLKPVGDNSKYSDFDGCEIIKINGDIITLNCYRPSREPRTGKPFTLEKIFQINSRDIPKYFTK
jgi:hypothetical protein